MGWSYNLVSSGYFSVFHIPLRRGRLFTRAESETEAPVAIVGESVARRFWPREDAIGQTVTLPPPDTPPNPQFTRRPPFTTARVIGVVADRMSGITTRSSRSFLYFPTMPSCTPWSIYLGACDVLPGSTSDVHRLQPVLDQIAPNLADFLNPMDDLYALQIYPFRVTSWVAGFLAGVALLLTLSGIYGVMAYPITQRTRDRDPCRARRHGVDRDPHGSQPIRPPRRNRRRNRRRSHVGHRSSFRSRNGSHPAL